MFVFAALFSDTVVYLKWALRAWICVLTSYVVVGYVCSL